MIISTYAMFDMCVHPVIGGPYVSRYLRFSVSLEFFMLPFLFLPVSVSASYCIPQCVRLIAGVSTHYVVLVKRSTVDKR